MSNYEHMRILRGIVLTNSIAITTGSVNGTSADQLLEHLKEERIHASKLVTHHFKKEDIEKAYSTAAQASKYQALKVIVEY